MGRKLPRAFFWMDQQLIRGGVWIKLSSQARLAYVALCASCDREGLSIWSRSKLMELSSCQEPEQWHDSVIELEAQQLILSHPDHIPPAIQLLPLPFDGKAMSISEVSPDTSRHEKQSTSQPIVIHTQTTIQLGGKSCS